ncbi:LOW QUALITY PROTEIN: 5'-nucleotidase domain-containing protein 3-like [Haliotis rubra]|uniref:LOW QUALITY PROTEIN: 5'-nucleotidase domain-containing protein 3-like n=1 Tax=Haliotis rubra TaxID=36100 RepID=UPI001EE5A90B|nr:LOW QUALITY PROTEIN: 5'-nucleotidase domain-containing protein 3-like [Haliotis rubra]
MASLQRFTRVFCKRVSRSCITKSKSFCTSSNQIHKDDLWKIYHKRKQQVQEKSFAADVNKEGIFANNEMHLGDVEVYGFDYDYTLAHYTTQLHYLLYRLGQQALVNDYKYPNEISNFKYDPDFAIRGLHYDVRQGLLMKIDSFHNIQLGTVYRGMQAVSDVEVKATYEGTHVSLEKMNTFYGTGPMHQLVDLFALPEVTLISNITEYFVQNNITYDPEYVFYDVRNAVQGVHSSGLLHQKIMENLGEWWGRACLEELLLERLSSAGKKLFLITNSGFPFIHAGMSYMIGDDWQDLFDVIITNARKPKFFNEASRPFRTYDPALFSQSWDRVQTLEKGKVYQQGNFYLLTQMTGWYGSRVLYFGDHVYSDLADPSLRHGWRTGAIIPELEAEIEQQNDPAYKSAVRWLVSLQQLIEKHQCQECPEQKEVIQTWLEERDDLRNFTKAVFNPRFGNPQFRTYHNPTYFTRRLASHLADIYMSSLTNLLHYSVDHSFYPHRVLLPHEPGPFSKY